VPKLSVTVITKNEAAQISAALASVAWADEIVVVVDSASTDETAAIARHHTSRVFSREWAGFAAQKNWAADQAANDWILSIDADERVSPALATEIQRLLAQEPPMHGYRMPYVNFYLNRWMHSTDWYPDSKLRLYDRRVAQWKSAHIHEGVEVKGPVGELRQELQHYPYRDISHHIQKMNPYTTLSAKQMASDGRRVSSIGILVRPMAAFLRNYVLRNGWRDGSAGLVVSILNSYYVFLKFAKLWEMNRGGQNSPSRGPR
jgi:glycosyltransferase involved in cell wall biosynthesis